METAVMNKNTGHGHVFPRPDKVKARCGGPALCVECAKDLARKNQIGTAPIQPEYQLQMRALAETVDEYFNGVPPSDPRKVGFVILVFPFGEVIGGRMNYISNANRENVKTALKEQLAYWEGMPDNQVGNA